MITQKEIEKEIQELRELFILATQKKDDTMKAYFTGQIKVYEKFLGEECSVCGGRYLEDEQVGAIQDDGACLNCQKKHDQL